MKNKILIGILLLVLVFPSLALAQTTTVRTDQIRGDVYTKAETNATIENRIAAIPPSSPLYIISDTDSVSGYTKNSKINSDMNFNGIRANVAMGANFNMCVDSQENIFYTRGSTSIKTFAKYDFITKKTTELEQLPNGTTGGYTTIYNEEFYIFGGTDDAGATQQATYKYNFNTGKWFTLAKSNTTYSNLTPWGYKYGTKLFLYNGDLNGTTTAEVYNFSDGTWSNSAFVGTADYRSQSLCGATTDEIYIAGGYNSSTTAALTTFSKYSIANNTITPLTAMPYALRNAVSVYYNDKIYVMGGLLNGGSVNTSTLEVYTMATNSWETYNLNYIDGPTPSGVSTPNRNCRYLYHDSDYNYYFIVAQETSGASPYQSYHLERFNPKNMSFEIIRELFINPVLFGQNQIMANWFEGTNNVYWGNLMTNSSSIWYFEKPKTFYVLKRN